MTKEKKYNYDYEEKIDDSYIYTDEILELELSGLHTVAVSGRLPSMAVLLYLADNFGR